MLARDPSRLPDTAAQLRLLPSPCSRQHLVALDTAPPPVLRSRARRAALASRRPCGSHARPRPPISTGPSRRETAASRRRRRRGDRLEVLTVRGVVHPSRRAASSRAAARRRLRRDARRLARLRRARVVCSVRRSPAQTARHASRGGDRSSCVSSDDTPASARRTASRARLSDRASDAPRSAAPTCGVDPADVRRPSTRRGQPGDSSTRTCLDRRGDIAKATRARRLRSPAQRPPARAWPAWRVDAADPSGTRHALVTSVRHDAASGSSTASPVASPATGA
jgi:hypothetical protein